MEVGQALLSGAGAAIAGMGTTGLLVLLLAVGLRTWGRLERKQAEGVIDLSGGGGMSLESLSGLLTGLLVSAVVLSVVAFVWHKMGIVRLAASAYLLQLILIASTATFGYITLGPMRDPDDPASRPFAGSPESNPSLESSPWSHDISPAGSTFDPSYSGRSPGPPLVFSPAQ